jgi:RNA-directed DNA polymerase
MPPERRGPADHDSFLETEGRMAGTDMDQSTRAKLLVALKVAHRKAKEENQAYWANRFGAMIGPCEIGMPMEGLEEIRPIMKAVIGWDPLEVDTPGKGEKQPPSEKSQNREPPSLQDLSERIYAKAKAEPAHRFWGLYVHVAKMETLRVAYQMAKENNGAPGIDGVTFEAIEESGVEPFLEVIRTELVSRTYRPMRNRRKEIPKDNGKVRVLGIPSIRDRVVQGALRRILEPIFEADFQPGSYGYRPNRSAHQAIETVARAIASGKTRVIDLDLKAYFDNVRHHILMEKVARRVEDPDVLHLLALILKASGKKGVPQGGVISPLLSNVYLNEVDRMLEKAKNSTRQGQYTQVEYARYADDMVILVSWHPSQDWLVGAVDKRLREELAKIQVEVNEEKSRTVDLKKGETFDFLGFRWQWAIGKSGKGRPFYMPLSKKRKALTEKITEICRRLRSQPVNLVVKTINPVLSGWVNYFRVGNSSKCFSFIRYWVTRKIRRHMMRARQRRGFGWERWSNEWIFGVLGLFDNYKLKHFWKTRESTPHP